MIDLPLKAKVECTDGHAGQSVTVVVDRKTAHVTHLIVKEKKFPHRRRMVPVDRVEHSSHDLIRLNCTEAELSAMDPFIVDKYVEKPVNKYPSAYAAGEVGPLNKMPPQVEKIRAPKLSAGEVAVEPDMPVKATDGSLAKIDELLIDPESGNVTHIVIREGHFWGQKEVALPVSTIDHTADGIVYLKFDKQALEEYASDPSDHNDDA